MIYEIISVLLLIDSAIGLLISFTKLGDKSIEENKYIKRFMPLTKGWTILYFILALYITWLTFGLV